MSWDGRIERREIPNDHDKLTRLLVLVEGQAIDIAGIKKDFRDHEKLDDNRYIKTNWFIGIGVGIIATLKFLIK